MTDEAPRGRATIRDVAAAAGVAPSTVSRALSRPGQVSGATARRIREVANELGYRTNNLTAEPPTRLTGLLGIVVADIENPFFAGVVKGAHEECTRLGYGLVVADSEETAALERASIDQLAPYVDGVILVSSRMSETAVRKTAETRPTVLLNRVVRGVPGAIYDMRPGIQDACRHLRELGHEAVTFLDGPEASWTAGIRWHELVQACADNHMTLHRCGPNVPGFEGGIAAEALYRRFNTSAVIAFNDLVATGFIAALRQRGVDVPGEVSVVGVDDVPLSSLVSPPLTTIRLPRRQLGALSAQLVIDRVRGTKPRDAGLVVAATKLVVRASTARRRR